MIPLNRVCYQQWKHTCTAYSIPVLSRLGPPDYPPCHRRVASCHLDSKPAWPHPHCGSLSYAPWWARDTTYTKYTERMCNTCTIIQVYQDKGACMYIIINIGSVHSWYKLGLLLSTSVGGGVMWGVVTIHVQTYSYVPDDNLPILCTRGKPRAIVREG